MSGINDAAILAAPFEGPEVTVDTYATTKQDNDWDLASDSTYKELGEAIAIAAKYRITGISFYLKKVGTPTGNATIVIYACSGTPGSTGVPTGSTLATATLDVSTLTTSYVLTRVNFDYTMSAAGNVCIGLTYTGGSTSGSYIKAGRDASSPSHAGNQWVTATPGSGWSYGTANDMIFSLFGHQQY